MEGSGKSVRRNGTGSFLIKYRAIDNLIQHRAELNRNAFYCQEGRPRRFEEHFYNALCLHSDKSWFEVAENVNEWMRNLEHYLDWILKIWGANAPLPSEDPSRSHNRYNGVPEPAVTATDWYGSDGESSGSEARQQSEPPWFCSEGESDWFAENNEEDDHLSDSGSDTDSNSGTSSNSSSSSSPRPSQRGFSGPLGLFLHSTR